MAHTKEPLTIPLPLQSSPHWLLWSSQPHPEQSNKTIKKPQKPAWQNNPDTFDTVINNLVGPSGTTENIGLGFLYTPDHPFICVDIDDFTPDNLTLISSLDSYTEISPSGHGAHVIVSTPDKAAVIKVFSKGRRYGTYKRDLFISGGFVTVTHDCVPPELPIRSIPADELIEILQSYFIALPVREANGEATVALAEPTTPSPDAEQTDTPPATKAEPKLSQAYIRGLLKQIPVKSLTSTSLLSLAYLDPACIEEAREPWLLIGQALHHHYDGALCSLQLWDEWSSLGNKYDKNILFDTWQSFTADPALLAQKGIPSPITIATLIALSDAQAEQYPDIGGLKNQQILGTYDNFKVYLAANRIVPSVNVLTMDIHPGIPDTKAQDWFTTEDNANRMDISSMATMIRSDFMKLDKKVHGRAFCQRDVENYIARIASSRLFNPVADYFHALEWDGVDRISDLRNTIIPADLADTPVYHTYLDMWLKQVCAAACEPEGSKARLNFMIIFAGGQGVGKTMWVQSLFPPGLRHYCSADKNVKISKFQSDNVKLLMELSQLLICNINEVDTVFGGDSWFKAFLDETTTNRTLPYGRRPVEMRRRTVFVGSTNQLGFLTDSTGNRRFGVMEIDRLDFKAVQAMDLDQVWAQATYEYKRVPKWWFDEADPRDKLILKQMEKLNKKVVVLPHEELADQLFDYYDTDAPGHLWTPKRIADIRADLDLPTSRHKDQLGAVMKRTIIAWHGMLDNAPPIERRRGRSASQYYPMPPLREVRPDIPFSAFINKGTPTPSVQ